MKLFSIAVFLFFIANSCKKSNTCQNAEIVQIGISCNMWNLKVGSKTYPVDNLPIKFEENGLKVCVRYALYDDLKFCPCCGGKRVVIISIEKR